MPTPREVLTVIGPPALGVALWAVGLRAADWLGVLPPARPGSNPDRTVLAYKAQIVQSKHQARIVLMGDSSCLTGVDAPELSALLPNKPPILNLGLILGLSWETYGEALGSFLNANPGQIQTVVLLITPQKLKDRLEDPHFELMWRNLRSAAQRESTAAFENRPLARVLSAEFVRERLLSSVLDAPLKGSSAGFYGFASGLCSFLVAHDGSLIEFGSYNPRAPSEKLKYTLSRDLEEECRRFRRVIPRGTRLVAGIMPLPETLVGRSYRGEHKALLAQWNQQLEADDLLLDLPATLPNGLFASGAHLNDRGQRRFTRLLAKELARIAESKPTPKLP